MLELQPLSIAGARAEVRRLHRHLPKIVGGLFACSVWADGELVGVGVASEPKASRDRGKRIVEITHVATTGHRNACSCLYGALCRAAAAVGYTRAKTFTRLDEPGTSLRAAGFTDEGVTEEQSWDRPSGPRGKVLSQVRRWSRQLGSATREQATRDKARDRALTAAGWRVLRFTGSEIWKEPERCAREAMTIASNIENAEETR